MSTTQATDLQQQMRQLLRRLQLPDTAVRPDAPPIIKRMDVQAATRLLQTVDAWNDKGLFDESERLVHDVLLKSPETRTAFLASEVEFLQRIEATGEDQLHRGPYGLVELALPISVRGAHVHLLRSGKFREQPFTEAELKELAFAAGMPLAAVEAAAATLPIRNGERLASYIHLHRRLRDAIAAALEAQLQASLLSGGVESSESLTSLGALAEGAAHQFSNLLSVVLGYTSLVLAKHELPPEAVAALNQVADAAQKGRRLTEEILAVAGSQRDEEPVSSFHASIERALALLQADRPAARRIALELRAEFDQVPAAPDALETIALNLLRHALDSAAPDAAVRLSTRNVREAGVEQILAEVREGDAAESDETTRVAFPVVREPLTKSGKPVRRRLAPSSIWVADDDPAVRELCRRVLVAEGHSVVDCESGEALRRKLAEAASAPDLVVYDFSMPDVDGVEFVSWLRRNGHRTPVILISGFNAEHPDLKRVLQTRKVFLLQKPFSFRDMSDLVTIAMGETLVG
jgi:CheY-like chemotaxis protein